MGSRKDPEEVTEIRVTDRRRFTEDGDERPGADAESVPVLLPAAPAGQSPAEGPPPSARSAETSPLQSGPPQSGAPQSGAPRDSAPRDSAPRDSAPRDSASPALEPMGAEEFGIQAVFAIFWQSAMLALGAADPSGQALPVDLAEARQAIGLLQLLQDKTTGNLTQDEAQVLLNFLHDAQVRYVEVAEAVQGRTPAARPGRNP